MLNLIKEKSGHAQSANFKLYNYFMKCMQKKYEDWRLHIPIYVEFFCVDEGYTKCKVCPLFGHQTGFGAYKLIDTYAKQGGLDYGIYGFIFKVYTCKIF